MEIKEGNTIVVWFSCGAASAVAAKKVIELYGSTCNIRIVNTPIAEEDPDNKRFLRDVQEWLQYPIETAINSKYPDSCCETVWQDKKYMANKFGAPCTKQLKKGARYEWEDSNHHDYLVMGYTAEEQDRHDKFKLNERDNILPILIDLNLTKEDCFEICIETGLVLPLAYLLGFPNANCVGCVKASSATYWNHVRKHYPEVFEARAKLSRLPGARLVWYKKRRIFLDELPPDAKGHKMKSLKSVDCGIFCK